MTRKPQSAYEQAYGDRACSTDEHIFSAMYSYLTQNLGLSEKVARSRAEAEVRGEFNTKVVAECEAATGMDFAGKTVLDLGAGLGGLSAELASRGAKVIAIEPGGAWRAIAAERLAKAGEGMVLNAQGENLPIAADSIDLIVSLQVLEHVQHPKRVIEEAYRVLKPGGYFYFSYENYLSFYEPHYRVRWFPLLPKRVGAAYLRRLGRDPTFLLEAVTYTTFPVIRKHLFATGFECMRHIEFRSNLRSRAKNSLKWRALKAISRAHEGSAMKLLTGHDYLLRVYKTAIYELMRKPLTR